MSLFLINRLQKRFRHLGRWAKRQGITCFRIYDRDIPEAPAIVDYYDGEAVAWVYDRMRDQTTDDCVAWREEVRADICQSLMVPPEKVFVKTRRRQSVAEQYRRSSTHEHRKIVKEQGLLFEVNLSDYVDTGLFLDHRRTRAMVRETSRDRSVLNLFAYTGSFTCYAAQGGARKTTTVDLSQTYCHWAVRNLELNGFSRGETHRVFRTECLEFLNRADKRRDQYDLIVCDPPTFSNSKGMRFSSFSVDRDHPQLILACVKVLSPSGDLFFSTNSRRFALRESELPQETSVEDITRLTIPDDFRDQRVHRCFRIRHRAKPS